MSDRYTGAYTARFSPGVLGDRDGSRGRRFHAHGGCTCRGNPEQPCRYCEAGIDALEDERVQMSIGRSAPDPDDQAWAEREEIAYERWLDTR